MRNGDYIPTRLEAQHDAANLLVGAKTQSNPESTVGVIAMTGEVDGAELLISPTDDMGKILTALHGVPIRSSSRSNSSSKKSELAALVDRTDITGAIQVASLALKHRRNKNGSQRVVVFLGSPLASDVRTLQKCGRQLKKNNIALDVVCLGELEENEPLAQELVNAANGVGDSGERTCHLVTVPPGVLPSDVLVGSPIIAGNAAAAAMAVAGIGGGGGAGGGDAFAEYGGVDPNMDPELAMALRVSMEEERARQERMAAERAAAAATTTTSEEGKAPDELQQPTISTTTEQQEAGTTTFTTRTEESIGGGMEPMAEDDDEDALLQQALAMSMQEHSAATSLDQQQMMEMDEDEEMQMALQMSMPGSGKEDEGATSTSEETQTFQDPDFVNQLLSSMPGVDPNDPAIQQALQALQRGEKKKKDNGDKKDG